MASENFTYLADHLANARVNYSTDTFKAAIVTVAPDETALDGWDYFNDVTNECADGDYTAGGFAVTVDSVTLDAANNRVAVTFSAANPTYSSATISGVGCIIYKSTGTGATSPVLHWVDWGGTVSSTNGNFVVTFSTPFYINR